MTLKQFIQNFGDNYCAELFNIKPRTAQSWRLGERYPSRKKAYEIIEKTNLKMKDIF